MNRILKDRSFRLSIILTLVFFGVGILFLFIGLASFNWLLFLALPIVLGISIGSLPNIKLGYYGAGIAVICLFLALLDAAFTGFICIAMALGLIVPFFFLGIIINHLVRRYRDIRSTERFPILLLPLIPFLIAAPLENLLNDKAKAEIEVRTQQIFHYTPLQVYDAIKSVDTLIADKPFLMYVDLPVPVKCVLEKEEVGGLRVCYFKQGNLSSGDFGGGTITEKITELVKGKILKMDVIDCNIIGRKWLGFKNAIYYFDSVGVGDCKLTRITTYTSTLYPRIYWEPLEKLGITQEHEYVFNNLRNDLQKKYGK
jgi:hypothetical protein